MDMMDYMTDISVNPKSFPLRAPTAISKVMFNYTHHLLSAIAQNYRVRSKSHTRSDRHLNVTAQNCIEGGGGGKGGGSGGILCYVLRTLV